MKTNMFLMLQSFLYCFLDVPPSTAEIIQRCLSVNPFDAKFREANMQINCNGNSTQNSPPETGTFPISLPSMLKLPSFASQSPGIFSNISVLSADFDEFRKNIDFTRKVQQVI